MTVTFLLLSDQQEARILGAKPAGPLQKPFSPVFSSPLKWSRRKAHDCPPPQALRPSAPAARQTSSTSLASTAASSPYCIYFLFAKLHLSPQRLGHQKPHGGTEGADVGLCLLSGFSLRAKQVKESASNT